MYILALRRNLCEEEDFFWHERKRRERAEATAKLKFSSVKQGKKPNPMAKVTGNNENILPVSDETSCLEKGLEMPGGSEVCSCPLYKLVYGQGKSHKCP